jgi:hypothetical protein
MCLHALDGGFDVLWGDVTLPEPSWVTPRWPQQPHRPHHDLGGS